MSNCVCVFVCTYVCMNIVNDVQQVQILYTPEHLALGLVKQLFQL